MEEKYYLKSIFNEEIGCQEIFIAEKTTDKLIDKKEAVKLLNDYEQKIKDIQLKRSQKLLAIEELKKVKKYWDWYKNTEYKKGLLMDYFINKQIEELKREEVED